MNISSPIETFLAGLGEGGKDLHVGRE
jgi:hypothetical protein